MDKTYLYLAARYVELNPVRAKLVKKPQGFVENNIEMVGLDLAIKSTLNYRFLRKNGVTVRKTIKGTKYTAVANIKSHCTLFFMFLTFQNGIHRPCALIRLTFRYQRVQPLWF